MECSPPTAAGDAATLTPVRALNQVSYCPRLYYLQYVESLMPVNEYVEDGRFQHRRVHDPELANRTVKVEGVEITRSVMLSSERLGLVGKLDVLEDRNGQAIPVEYKRSTGPDQGYWDNDAIQLCAQALLLEEASGQAISEGVLYYQGSKRRVSVPLDEPLREKTLQALRLIRELNERETPPEPLPDELRHRCHGCSLAPICLPEETLYLLRRRDDGALTSNPSADEKAAPLRRVLPAAQEGAVAYLQEQGAYVGKRGEHLIVKKEGVEINRLPLAALRQVVIFGNVQVSTQALECLAANEIPVVYLTSHGRFIASLEPAPTKNISLRLAQYRAFTDPERTLLLARTVVKAKIANQRTLLMRTLRARGETAPVPAVAALAELLDRVEKVLDPAALLGLEGQAAHLYFSHFGLLLKSTPGRPFDFQKRQRRPPPDPVNTLLSFAYALLAKDCFSAVATVGFDPYQGFFHAGRYGRPSLALDLMEEFRPLIADSVVLTLVNNGLVASTDFLCWRDACQLTEAGRKKFFHTYERRLADLVTHPIFDYKMTYSRILEVQARLLAAFVRGEIQHYSGFTVR
jgi:CRISPR-associated protein Cas1